MFFMANYSVVVKYFISCILIGAGDGGRGRQKIRLFAPDNVHGMRQGSAMRMVHGATDVRAVRPDASPAE